MAAPTSKRSSASTFSNKELVVFALSLVGGVTRRVHTEDIAIKCHELFPGSFSWTKYPEIPDKDIVRVALTDARKQTHGALVEGRAGRTKGHSAATKREPVSDGWILTEAGLAFLNDNEEQLMALAKSGAQKDHRQSIRKQARRVKNHPLFAMFEDDPEQFSAPIGQLADLLRCRVDAEPDVWARRFESLRLTAAASDDPTMGGFVEKLEQSYQEQR